MTGLSRQMTQFSTEVYQQLARIRDDLATCNERLSRLESKASCSEELQRKRRQNNPKIAEAVRRLHTSNLNFSRCDPRQRLFASQRGGHICVGRGQAQSYMVWIMLPLCLSITIIVVCVCGSVCFFCLNIVIGHAMYLQRKCFPAVCKTHYETVRRNFLYSQPDHAEKAAAIKTSARCRSRRKRLLEARLTVLEAEELAFRKGVTIDLISDEEDGSFEGASGWIVRPPSFRSQELSDLCLKLQRRLEADPKYSLTHHKRLHIGEFSERTPPSHGPELDKFFNSFV
ncbi:hypothetical protein AMECASPLE_031709 [Ameca splendens]|uniref:Uncharacterized protein n=1 Tax=Ameca splendens TaxID=208324 RepID=A0ABV0Z487_9TELE